MIRVPSLVLVAVLACRLSVPAFAQPDPPKLLVVVVVDQMRRDYVTEYGQPWTGGLKRLYAEGAVFDRAAYPYFNTLTCVGHATIGTGAYPRTSGIVMNEWYDRTARKQLPCAEDDSVTAIGYTSDSGLVPNSPHRLLAPSLAEQLRAWTGGKVVTLALKPRSAIMLAGHVSDATTWFDDKGFTWTTSTAFTDRPVPEVRQFVEANPIEADLGKTWSKALPDAAYKYADDGLAERAPRGWTTTFPHTLASAKGPDFYAAWQVTPYADQYIVRMASALVDGMKLGQRSETDFLGISFSTLDLAGHAFGPRSHEVQDILAGLDRSLAALFDHLDRTVGRGRYTVALSADHGVAPVPEQRAAEHATGGRIDVRKATAAIEGALVKTFGEGKYVEWTTFPYVYLTAGIGERVAATPAAIAAMREAMKGVAGIRTVLQTNALAAVSPDPLLNAAALAQYPLRVGELLIVPEPYFIPQGLTATHGSPYGYDQQVPLIFMGAGIRRGHYPGAASPADIAPTLGALGGSRLPRADGHVLSPALAPAASPAAPRPTPR